MKLLALGAVISVGIAQVVAVPLRVILVSSSAQDVPAPGLDNLRFGHGIEHPHAVAKMMVKGANYGTGGGGIRRPCKASALHQKGVEVSNAFRKALGWPLIDPHAHAGVMATEMKPGFWSGELPHPHPHPHPHHVGEHNRLRVKQHRADSFGGRLHLALLNLGRWEGRAVAFVLGCGIGALLRMFTVLMIVMYRSVRGRRHELQHEYAHVTIIEEYEVAAPPPPTYASYPVDEKVAVDEAPKAQAPAEEAK